MKWFIGLYMPATGRWGLDSLLETRVMSEYFERELKYKRVIRDEHGAPVHPDTRERTVRICSRWAHNRQIYVCTASESTSGFFRKAEFFLNAMFFLIFPFAVCCHRLKRFFRPDRKRCYSNESKVRALPLFSFFCTYMSSFYSSGISRRNLIFFIAACVPRIFV